LYKATFKDTTEPLSWSHFTLTTESGIAVRALLYVPTSLGDGYWQQPQKAAEDIKVLVKHVFITSDLGEDALPKWASWVRAVVDGTPSFHYYCTLWDPDGRS
jgi:heat shock protein beta